MFRTTGLGISNIASLFMVMRYPYDSDEARAIGASLVGILTGESYYTSSLIAGEIGPFKKFDINKPYMMRVIRNHARAAGVDLEKLTMESKIKYSNDFENLNYTPLKVNHDILDKENLYYISKQLKESFAKALVSGEKFGYRNAQVSVLAPTGTISFAMDCGATSIEPFFSHIVYKKLSGGGFMTIMNPVITTSLKKLGYTKDQIEDILAYVLEKQNVTDNGFTYEKTIGW